MIRLKLRICLLQSFIPNNNVSSILVELGFCIAKQIPIMLFSKSIDYLPYIIRCYDNDAFKRIIYKDNYLKETIIENLENYYAQ